MPRVNYKNASLASALISLGSRPPPFRKAVRVRFSNVCRLRTIKTRTERGAGGGRPGTSYQEGGRSVQLRTIYSVERHLNPNGRDTYLIWTYSQVGRKCCFHNHNQRATLPAQRSRRTACVYTALAMTVNELHVFLSSQLKQERERKIERLGKRQALYTRLYCPRGFRSRKWPSCAAISGVRDTAYFRRCASSSFISYFHSLLVYCIVLNI